MKLKKVNIEIKSDAEIFNEVAEVMENIAAGKKVKKHRAVSFDSLDHFRSIITPERLRLLSIIRKHSPKTIYQLAKLAKRDYANVHRDVAVLERFDFLERDKKGLESCEKIEIGITV